MYYTSLFSNPPTKKIKMSENLYSGMQKSEQILNNVSSNVRISEVITRLDYFRYKLLIVLYKWSSLALEISNQTN